MTNKSWSCRKCRLDRSLHVRHIEDRYWSPQGVFFEAVMNACIVFCNTASSIEQERQIAEKIKYNCNGSFTTSFSSWKADPS